MHLFIKKGVENHNLDIKINFFLYGQMKIDFVFNNNYMYKIFGPIILFQKFFIFHHILVLSIKTVMNQSWIYDKKTKFSTYQE